VTSNSLDFSTTPGYQRRPHGDLATLFTDAHSSYWIGVDGLEQCLRENFGDYLDGLIEEMYFSEEPRRLDEILAADKELFDLFDLNVAGKNSEQLIQGQPWEAGILATCWIIDIGVATRCEIPKQADDAATTYQAIVRAADKNRRSLGQTRQK
jgi:hypothetical protein